MGGVGISSCCIAFNPCTVVFNLSTISQTYFEFGIKLDGVSLALTNDRSGESAEQDQTARMCRLILLYSLCKIKPKSRVAG